MFLNLLHKTWTGRMLVLTVRVTFLLTGLVALILSLPLTRDMLLFQGNLGSRNKELSDHDANDVFVMDVQNGWVHNLTHHPADDLNPRWSPDGNRIAFYSDREGATEIYVLHVSGIHLRRMTFNERDDYLVDWSPDGTQLLFVAAPDYDLYLMELEGQNVRRLTYTESGIIAARWWTDKTSIAFIPDGIGEERSLYLIDHQGGNQRRIADGSLYMELFPWSGQAQSITMHINGHPHVVNADGRNLRPLLDNVTTDIRRPVPSPDGLQIAFESLRDGNQTIYLMNADGSNLHRLINDPAHPYLTHFAWSPDGTSMAFRDASHIFIADTDGGDFRQLTIDPQRYDFLAWRPR